MAGLQLSGLASGLDTQTIIAQLMSVERQPRLRLERDQAAATARQTALKDILTKLKTLKTAASDLQSATTWMQAQKVTSTDATRVGARLSGSVDVIPGTYDVTVTALARGEQETWTYRSSSATRTLTVTNASGTNFSVSIPANSTVDEVATRINETDGLPITAVNFNGQLLLRSKETGTAAGGFTVSGFNLETRTSRTAAQNASYTLNGTAYTSGSNTIDNVVPGLELTLTGVTTTTGPIGITVGDKEVDKATVAAKLKAFVEAYNATQDLIRTKVGEKRVPTAANTVDAAKGALFADGGMTRIASDLRLAVSNPFAGNPAAMDELRELGITVGAATSTVVADNVNGKLAFDEAAFNKAWDANPAGVEKLLKGAGGFTQRIDALLNPLTQGGGLLDSRVTAADGELNRLKDGLKRMDDRLVRKEEILRRTFTALETAMMRAQSQQNDLASRLPSFTG